MTLNKLTTPFERRRVIEYGTDVNKVVRHWYEVQHVIGTLYKSKDTPDRYGTPEFKLFVFFTGKSDGLMFGWMSHPERYTVEQVADTMRRCRVDSVTHMYADLNDRIEKNQFIWNAHIEFFRQFDSAAADRYAQYRLDYYARKAEKEHQERLARQAEEAAERTRKRAEEEAIKSKYFGWADTMTPLRFGKARAKLDGFIRSDGKLYQLRDFIISLVKDGWEPVKKDDVVTWYRGQRSKPKTEHRLSKDGYSYKVSKTEYDFAVYLMEHKEVLNKG